MVGPHSHELADQLRAYTISCLRTGDKHAAAAASGLKPEANKICIHRLEEHGTLEPMPSPGRPPKFTPDAMLRALAVLEEHQKEQPTLLMLLDWLVEEGTIAAPADEDNFSLHLRAYCHANKMYINTTSTRTRFMLAAADHVPRLDFSESTLSMLGCSLSLGSIIFCGRDDT